MAGTLEFAYGGSVTLTATSLPTVGAVWVLRSSRSSTQNKITNGFWGKPDVVLEGGERIPSALGSLEVIWTRGHSPGHVCLHASERRALFSGDQILQHITPNRMAAGPRCA